VEKKNMTYCRNSHCLRPIFSANLLKTLQKGASVNLVAPLGQGREGLLENLKNTPLKNTLFLFVDIKIYRENYKGFILEMWKQLNENGEPPLDFCQLVSRLEEIDQNTIILLHHFDELLNNMRVDPKFDVNFFDILNNICDKAKISLLCVTEKPHNQSIVFIDGEVHSYSWLDLETKRLPKLGYDEIKFELKNRNLSLSSDELSLITWVVHEHIKPYSLLNFFSDKIAKKKNNDLELPRRLEMWLKQFNETNNLNTPINFVQFQRFAKEFCNMRQVNNKLSLDYFVDLITKRFSTMVNVFFRLFKIRQD
jgi:hypothetical protein